MRQNAFLGWSVLLLGSSLLAYGCSEDDPIDGAVAGGSSGAAGNPGAGAGGAAGSSGGSGAGTSGAGGSGTGGSAGAGGTGTGGSAGAAGNASGGAGPDAGAGGDAGAQAFTLSSPAFDNNPGCGPGDPARDACDLFPVENTGLGDGTVNVSPAFAWTGAPADTQSFAIAMHDLVYMPQGEPFTHWVLWNIPGAATGLPANLPRGIAPGAPAENTGQVSFLDDDGFAGSGACGNVYELVLYALDAATFTPPNAADPDAVESALDDSAAVLATTTIRARSNPAGPCN
jgi:phosphatidylethanolamine-binding protein (PEBP) family uncharacterized protein